MKYHNNQKGSYKYKIYKQKSQLYASHSMLGIIWCIWRIPFAQLDLVILRFVYYCVLSRCIYFVKLSLRSLIVSYCFLGIIFWCCFFRQATQTIIKKSTIKQPYSETTKHKPKRGGPIQPQRTRDPWKSQTPLAQKTHHIT